MLLQLQQMEKRFGGVTALRSGTLTVQSGEVHLLMGENGAGKSTLMKIVAGMYQPDGGAFLWQGQPVRLTCPADASALGIAMVHQESLLAPHLTVAENIFLGKLPSSGPGFVDRRRIQAEAARLIEAHNFPLQADWRVDRLSPAGKQLVEICRAIHRGSSLLIFDEPTSSLSESETHEVFRIVRTLRERGTGVIYITHRLEELRSLGDRVTVLRDGETVHTAPLAECSTEAIIQHMVGRPVTAIYTRESLPPGEELLRVDHLSVAPLLKDISFSLRAGEIVGLAGLVGAGRTELCRALFGLDRITSGSVHVAGRPVSIRTPRQAVAAGLALIPEDRQRTGLTTALPIAHNITLAHFDEVSRHGFLNRAAEQSVSQKFIQQLRIKCESPRQRAGRLSGGNQQKVAIAKWLVKQARVFLFDEPTRGIDVGAKVEVFETMDALARAGAAVLMVSSELPELLQVPDRILVMRQGTLTGSLPGRPTQEAIMRLAAFDKEPAA
ncbi:MAG: sugar ABC transporter ATP-binding protein [Bryobacterales bacterium]|nr:sugar ABC transporter ATP-binding protein [Bryobacterales bacterium]